MLSVATKRLQLGRTSDLPRLQLSDVLGRDPGPPQPLGRGLYSRRRIPRRGGEDPVHGLRRLDGHRRALRAA
eukprot:3039077-Prorocentrum_lima.AAC.1